MAQRFPVLSLTAIVFLFLVAGTARCQTKVDLGRQGSNVNFSSLTTQPFQTGNALPGTCAVGQMYFLYTAAAGSNVYGCTGLPGTWTLEGNGTGGGGAWGGITGTLSSQTDLQNALNAKPTAALVTTLGSPGVDTNVASEKAVRTAISAVVASWGAITGTLASQTDLQTALNTKPTAALVTTVGTPGSNSNVPSEAAVRSAITSGNPSSGAVNDCQTANGSGGFSGGANCTIDSNGNVIIAGNISTGGANTASSLVLMKGITSGQTGIGVNDVAGNQHIALMPTANGSANQLLELATSGATCPTNPLYTGLTCDQLAWVTPASGTVTETIPFLLASSGSLDNPAIAYGIGVGIAASNGDWPPYVQFASTGGKVVLHWALGHTWTGNIDIKVRWFENSGGSGNVQWNAATFCYTVGSTVTGTVTYNTPGTAISAASGNLVESDILAISTTGCAVDDDILIEVYSTANGSGGTTYGSPTLVDKIVMVMRHT